MYQPIFITLLLAGQLNQALSAETSNGENCDSSMRHTLITCPFEELQRQETSLDLIISRLKTYLTDAYPDTQVNETSYKQSIDIAQTNWLQYRNSECKWRGYAEGNQEMFSRSMSITCRTKLTEERIRELQILIKE